MNKVINQNILQHYKGYELLIKQLDEAINRYKRHPVAIPMDFYNIDGVEVIESFLADSVPYQLIGGYDEAMAKRLVIGEDLNDEEYVTCMKAHFNSKFNHLSHRDIQGALYNTGFEISKFGDMWIDGEDIYFYVVSELSEYLQFNLTQVSHCKVSFEPCSYAVQTYQFEEINCVVSSLRLDKVVSAIIKKSREKAKELIVSQLVKVNYKVVEDCSFMCDNNDILSIRAHGRYRIEDITVNKKNGNYRLSVNKYR